MDQNFHYHVTYTAAVLAGFSPEEGLKIARAAQYVDECSITVQSNSALFWANLWDTFPGDAQIQEVLNIWPVFHFLPGDYNVIEHKVDPSIREGKYPKLLKAVKLVCNPESQLVRKMVEAARDAYNGESADEDRDAKLQRVGITMHVLADTFAHQGFAGIPLSYINEVKHVYEVKRDGTLVRRWLFLLEYSPAISSSSFGYLGHGRIGHLVDQPGEYFAYQAAWKDAAEDGWIVRYNPLEFYCAYLQMKNAMEYILGKQTRFARCIDRSSLLNPLGRYWPKTRRFLRALKKAGTDDGLPDPWYKAVRQVERPGEYEPYDKDKDEERRLIDSFISAAVAHRDVIWRECTPLKEYLK